jgi:hypothetical protein
MTIFVWMLAHTESSGALTRRTSGMDYCSVNLEKLDKDQERERRLSGLAVSPCPGQPGAYNTEYRKMILQDSSLSRPNFARGGFLPPEPRRLPWRTQNLTPGF